MKLTVQSLFLICVVLPYLCSASQLFNWMTLPTQEIVHLFQINRSSVKKSKKEQTPPPVVEWNPEYLAEIDRPGFSMKYPLGWKIAEQQPGYNPDRNFTIDTPGNSYITIEVINAKATTDTAKIMKNVLFALDGPAIETYSRSKMKNWGSFEGNGKHLKGKILSLDPGGIRVFAAKYNDKLILITEFYYSNELEEVLPGFDLISQTFTFKEA